LKEGERREKRDGGKEERRETEEKKREKREFYQSILSNYTQSPCVRHLQSVSPLAQPCQTGSPFLLGWRPRQPGVEQSFAEESLLVMRLDPSSESSKKEVVVWMMLSVLLL